MVSAIGVEGERPHQGLVVVDVDELAGGNDADGEAGPSHAEADGPLLVGHHPEQGKKITKLSAIGVAKTIWEEVVAQVKGRDLAMAVRIEAPRERLETEALPPVARRARSGKLC